MGQDFFGPRIRLYGMAHLFVSSLAKSKKMKLQTIIVTYKTREKKLLALKKQLSSAGISDKQICVVDNSKNNRGYSKAVNIGLKKGKKEGYQYFLIANPDIELINFDFEKIKKGFLRFDIFGGVFVQNKITYCGGKIDPVFLSGGLNTKKNLKTYFLTDFVSGSLMFINKKAIDRIGYFDEKFFLYYEDVEYCYRAKLNKLNVGINSKIKYRHFEQSAKNPKKQHYLEKSHQLFVWQYGAWWQKAAYLYRKWRKK